MMNVIFRHVVSVAGWIEYYMSLRDHRDLCESDRHRGANQIAKRVR